MRLTTAVFTIILLLITTVASGEVLLTAKSMDDVADYYVISVNEKRIDITPFNTVFLFGLDYLDDGSHEIEISTDSYENGESPTTTFTLTKKSNKKWIMYTLTNQSDPDKFIEPQRIKIRNLTYEIELIKELNGKISKYKKGDLDLDGDTDKEDLVKFVENLE